MFDRSFVENAVENEETLRNLSLTGLDLCHCALSGSDWHDVTLTRCRLTGADLRGSSFRAVRLIGCECSGARFSESYAYGCTMTDCKAVGADFTECTLDHCIGTRSALQMTLWGNSRWRHVVLTQCSLRECALAEVQLHAVQLADVDLTQATLFRTALRGIDLTHCTIDGALLSPDDCRGAVVTPPQVVELARLLGLVIR